MHNILQSFQIASSNFTPPKFVLAVFLALIGWRRGVPGIPYVTGNRPFCASTGDFNEMAWESAAAHRAGNVGTRPATHTTDAAPRPVCVEAPAMSWHGLRSECRLQSAGSKSAPSFRAGCARREGGGREASGAQRSEITVSDSGKFSSVSRPPDFRAGAHPR